MASTIEKECKYAIGDKFIYVRGSEEFKIIEIAPLFTKSKGKRKTFKSYKIVLLRLGNDGIKANMTQEQLDDYLNRQIFKRI